RPEVFRQVVDQRGQHLVARVRLAHAAADAAFGGDADAAQLAPRPGRAAPDAGPARRLEQAAGDIAAHFGAQAALELLQVGDLHVGARLRVGDVADEQGVDAVFLADLLQRHDIELAAADGGEQVLSLAELDEARPRLRRLHLLLELPRR